MKTRSFIGTSNVVIPGNKLSFPAAFRKQSRLHYYSHLFNSVEINSSFYKTPLKATFEKWAADTVPGFRFSVKLSRAITHAKNLEYDPALLSDFMEKAAAIGKKKGCLLIQFPGSVDLSLFMRVEQLLGDCKQFDPAHWPIAVEFRNPGWLISETYEMLDQFGAGLVIQDFPKAPVTELQTKAAHVYLRFHGEKGSYRGSYTNEVLQQYAQRIKTWMKAGKTVFAYFNNTIGDAFLNAQTLQKLTGSKP